jgi:hypothetical protein
MKTLNYFIGFFDMTTFTKQEIKSALQKGAGEITLTKTDGNKRILKCTLHPDKLPVVEFVEGKVSKPENPDTLSVWDLDNNGWRSFRIDSIISANFS